MTAVRPRSNEQMLNARARNHLSRVQVRTVSDLRGYLDSHEQKRGLGLKLQALCQEVLESGDRRRINELLPWHEQFTRERAEREIAIQPEVTHLRRELIDLLIRGKELLDELDRTLRGR